MKWLHRRRFIELVIDPSSGQLSMSRLLLPWVLLLDAAWAYAAVKGWTPKDALAPVSSMLGVCTGAICGVYGLSTFKSGLSQMFGSRTVVGSPLLPPNESKSRIRPAGE